MERDKAEVLRLKKEKVSETQIQFYSQDILIAKDYYSSHLCIVFFFFIHFSLSILILTFISFSSLLFLYLPFFFSLFFSLFYFPCPLLGKEVFFHLKIIRTSLYHSSTKLAPSVGVNLLAWL